MRQKSSAQRSSKQSSQGKPSLPSLFSETFGTEIVQVTVGNDEFKRTFAVHKNLLVSKSRFFSAMFDSNFLDAVTSSAFFPDDDPSAFEVLMEWIYYDSLKSISLNSSHTQEEGQENMRKIIATLGLADKYCIDELADRCLTILYHRLREYVSCQLDLDMIAFIYATTGPISMARKYAASELAAAPRNQEVSPPPQKTLVHRFTPMHICEISANAFHHEMMQNDSEFFQTSIYEIDQIIHEKELVEDEETLRLIQQKLPHMHRRYTDVFSKLESDRIPPHRIYDHKIQLEAPLPNAFSPLYGQGTEELKATKQYLLENLEKEFIVNSNSPFASPILFVKKADGKLRFASITGS
ncbi:hypothetical protein GMDG_01477 [Pseudogymnoascus destructans 20631-21]|uniref:BTB domain-containing protein n=1 Tax=Pseudogymnoascus destructans (strain ATCC MYA-4855 / 20631-21) TaxID=658429 RepID=L8FXF8_PSED2|nr:hypothetical protein GMDG_01477 [Pseudogymnoascus destructans 20631-21]